MKANSPFLMSFPAWTLVDDDHGKSPVLRYSDDVKMFAIFTDDDLVNRFCDKINHNGGRFHPKSIGDIDRLASVLRTAREEGFTHVGIDVEFGSNSLRWINTIEGFLRHVRDEP